MVNNSTNRLRSVSEGAGMDSCALFFAKSIERKTRTITGVISSSVLDRDGEIILVEAVEASWAKYMTNPVVLAAHSHRLDRGHSPVVGRMISEHRDGDQFVATVQFAETPLGEEYWVLYRDKVQRAFSVGFIGKESEVQLIDGAQVRVWKKIELLEVSCVPVPSNPSALSKAAAKKQQFVEAKKLEAAAEEYDNWNELIKEYGEEFVVETWGSREEKNRKDQEWINRIFYGDKQGRLPGEKTCQIHECYPKDNEFLDAFYEAGGLEEEVEKTENKPDGKSPDFVSMVLPDFIDLVRGKR